MADNSRDADDKIHVRVYTYDNNDVISLTVHLDDKIDVVLSSASEHIPRGARVRVICNGRMLQFGSTFRESNVKDGTALHLVATVVEPDAVPDDVANQPRVGVYRGGLEKHLQAGVERQDVIGLRLVFLARAGFLTSEHLQILYTNTDLIEQPRGYTQPSISRIRLFIINALQTPARGAEGSSEGGRPDNSSDDNATGNGTGIIDVRSFYTEQEEPNRDSYYPSEFVSNSSFALMMLEGGFPPNIARQFLDVADLSWIDANTPLPPVPLRVIQCENLWLENESPSATITSVATAHNMLGPGTPVQPPINRVMNDFHKFMLLIFGLLIGLIFNVLAIVYVYHPGIPIPMRTGIIFGLIGGLIFSLFINIAGRF